MRTWLLFIVLLPIGLALTILLPALLLPPALVNLVQTGAGIIEVVGWIVLAVRRILSFVSNPRALLRIGTGRLWFARICCKLHLFQLCATIRVEIRCRDIVSGVSFDFTPHECMLFCIEGTRLIKQSFVEERTIFRIETQIVHAFGCIVRVFAARGEQGTINVLFSSTTTEKIAKRDLANKALLIDLRGQEPSEYHLVVFPCRKRMAIQTI